MGPKARPPLSLEQCSNFMGSRKVQCPSWTCQGRQPDLHPFAPIPEKPKEYAALRTPHSDEGMSTRAIAPIVGVHHDTVASDRKSPVGNPTPDPAHVERTVIAKQRHVTVASDRKSVEEHSSPEPWPAEPQLKPCSNFMRSRKI